MQTDRTTKGLLFAIALGLWVNVVGTWIRPTPVHAATQDYAMELSTISSYVGRIARGTCTNSKIC